VARIYTNLAALEVAPEGFEVWDIVPGLAFEEHQARTSATLLRRF